MMQKILALLVTMRPRQLPKNAFVFPSALFGGMLFEPIVLAKLMLSFVIFFLASGAVYIFNDIHDIEEDKMHKFKQYRPIASGRLTKEFAIITASLIAVFVLIIAYAFLGIYIFYVFFIYMLLNIFYTLSLKQIVILDSFIVALGFILRVLAGSIVADIQPSPWFILTTLFLALFISFGKRRSELNDLNVSSTTHRLVLEHYSIVLLDHLISALGAIIIINYSMYTISDRVLRFGNNYMTYTVPFVAYGIFRYFYLIYGNGKGERPVDILLTDKHMLITVTLWTLSCISIIYFM